MAEREEALREAQLLSALRHPNIIAYKESFIEDADKTTGDRDRVRGGGRPVHAHQARARERPALQARS